MFISKVDILGTEYTVEALDRKNDSMLGDENDGYCDHTTKSIVVAQNDELNALKDFDRYQKSVIRHEIIHAFLFESGFGYSCEHPQYGHDETMIDWWAMQSPKIFKVFEQLNLLE